ncbi:MAG: outer membrane beta-barrel protein [Flavipsychrobacter sp.]
MLHLLRKTRTPFVKTGLLTFILLFTLSRLLAQQQDSTTHSIFNDTLQIGEIIISAKTAIKINKDTISYQVDSFYKDPLATTEDVLKRLPGVEVSRDGTITINGKTVTKLYINGKEYDADDLTSITQNLPAEILEKIQVADYHSEEASFSGRKETAENKVINLQFKKKYKSGIYGRGAVGYGTKDRYQSGLFGNYMSKEGSRVTAIGNINNTGMSDVSNSFNNNAWRSPGVRNERKANINFSNNINPKWKLSGGYYFDNHTNSLTSSTLRNTYLANDSILLQEQQQNTVSQNNSHRLNLRSRWKPNEKLRINNDISISYRNQNADNNNSDITYQNEQRLIDFQRTTTVTNNNDDINLRLSNTVMKAFAKEKRTLIIRAFATYSNKENKGNNTTSNSYTMPLSSNTVINLINGNNKNLSTNVGIRYSEPIGKRNLLSLDYNNTYDNSNNNREVLLENNGATITDTAQSRTYENINIEHNIGLTYQYTTDRFYTTLGFQLLPYDRKTTDPINSNNNVAQKGINYAPSLHVQYDLSKTQNIGLGYNGRINTPNLNQLQPVPDYTDSLNIYIGNPNLKPEISNTISLNYRNYKPSGANTNINLHGSWYQQKITNNVIITNSKRETRPINADGNYSLSSSISNTVPILKKKIRLTTSIQGSLQNNVSVVNNILQKRKNYLISPRIRMVFFLEDIYEGSLTYNYSWNKTITTNSTNNLLQTHNLSQQGSFILPFNITWKYDISYISNNGLNQDFEQDFLLINTSVDKEFKKIKGLFLSIQAFDIFNKYPTVQRNINDNYYEDVAVNRIGSYYMLSLIYRFTSFPAAREVPELF